jgi:hypothetical protein
MSRSLFTILAFVKVTDYHPSHEREMESGAVIEADAIIRHAVQNLSLRRS